MEGLKDADGKPLTMIPAAQLKQGQELTKTTMKSVTVDTSAEVEKGMLVSQDMPTGTTNAVTVEALQGGLLVSVVQVGGDGSEAAAKKLASAVHQVIAAS